MSALFILDYGHPSYTGGIQTPPTSPAQIAAFVKFATAAFSTLKASGIEVQYELWNEPDPK